MILNNSSLRRSSCVVALSIVLSACSSMPSFTSGDTASSEQKATSTRESTTESTVQSDTDSTTDSTTDNNATNADVDGIQAPVQLSPEELEEQALAIQARNLMASINTFKLDKSGQQVLNSSQLRSITSAMAKLANEQANSALIDVQAVIDDPDFIASPNSAVWVLRGDIYRALENNENAIADYQRALKLVASNYQAHHRLGLIYRDAGKFELAKTHYTSAIQAWPGNAASYRNRGILFDLYVGDKMAALADYKVYKALLDFQVQSVTTPAKSLMKEQKLARQWILDIQRQIKTLMREQANG